MLSYLLLRYGYASIFAVALVEPDAALLAATFLSHRGYFSLPVVIAVSALATVIANQGYFWVARLFAGRVFKSRTEPGAVAGWFRRYGTWLVVIGRFLFGFRLAITASCGAGRMSAITFLAADSIGAVIWATIMAVAGVAIGHALEVALSDLRSREWWVADALFILTIALVLWFGHRRWSHRRTRKNANGAPDPTVQP